MTAANVGPLCLHAVVPTAEAAGVSWGRGVFRLAGAEATALFGGRPAEGYSTAAAVRHARVVERAFAGCSSVVPFRLGVEFGSRQELETMLRRHAPDLALRLARFAGQAEMGLKVKLGRLGSLLLPPGLEQVRRLAPSPADRSERIRHQGSERIFEGCYLIPRRSIEGFWQAVEEIGRHTPELPLLGSGPWAPYSFCGEPLSATASGLSSLPGEV